MFRKCIFAQDKMFTRILAMLKLHTNYGFHELFFSSNLVTALTYK